MFCARIKLPFSGLMIPNGLHLPQRELVIKHVGIANKHHHVVTLGFLQRIIGLFISAGLVFLASLGSSSFPPVCRWGRRS